VAALEHAAPWWLPGGQAQTIWAALGSRNRDGAPITFRRERWDTPDGDFIDVDLSVDNRTATTAPWLVLFHGLEGSSRSHYAQAFASVARSAGMNLALPHFRGCSGEINRAPRAYHSGDHEEVGWILARLRAHAGAPLFVAGVSLGGNALLRWAEEAGDTAATVAAAVASVCAPLDLTAAGHHIGRGFNRLLYTRMFLRSMKPRALAKHAQFPGLFDRDRLLAARDLYEFDDVFTAPLHGFAGVDDYWARGSAKPHLNRLRVPTLVINPLNDPFMPASSLPREADLRGSGWVTLAQPAHGGHVGFPHGRFPGHVLAMPRAVVAWLRAATS
jgi:predicted alpha/beta-fold hydrolase